MNPKDFNLEPVDASELSIDNVPTVEIVALPRRGFGFGMAVLWCLLFLLVTQVLPALVIFIPALAIELIANRQQTADGNGNPDATQEAKPILTRGAFDSPATQAALRITFVAAPVCGMLFSLFLLRRKVGRDWRTRIAFRLPHAEHAVLVVLLVFPLLVLSLALEAFVMRVTGGYGTEFYESMVKTMANWPIYLLVVGVAVCPAISEELFCRGFLGQGLVGRYGVLGGVFMTSFLFGAIHLNLLQFAFALCFGIVLHLIYLASRSIVVPMLLHFLNNLAGALDANEMTGAIGTSLKRSLECQPGLMFLASTLMVTAIGWGFYLSRVRIWMPHGLEAPRPLYPHAQLPIPSSANCASPGPIRGTALVLIIVSTAFFSAIWFGL